MAPNATEIPPEAKGCLRIAALILFLVALGLTYYLSGSIDVISAFKELSGIKLIFVVVAWIIVGILLLQLVVVYWGMSPDPRVKLATAIAVLATLSLGVSYAVSGSLNPIETFEVASTFELVVLAILCVLLFFSVVQFLFMYLLIWKIENDTGRAFDDVYCKFCDEKIFGSEKIVKLSSQCPHCLKWVHMACWKKNGGSIQEYCPKCLEFDRTSNTMEDFLDRYNRL